MGEVHLGLGGRRAPSGEARVMESAEGKGAEEISGGGESLNDLGIGGVFTSEAGTSASVNTGERKGRHF